MKLYVSGTDTPRRALAVARYQKAPVICEFAAPFDPAHPAKFRNLNPDLSIPVPEDNDGSSLWETDAIACRLGQLAGSDFWRVGAQLPDMIRWPGWGYWNLVRACDLVHFERVTRQRYNFVPVDAGKMAEGPDEFHRPARRVQAHLTGQDWLLDSGVNYADFRMACVLPRGDLAGLPLSDYPGGAGMARPADGASALG